MAFSPSSPSITLAVTDAGQNTAIQRFASQCRIYNEGPNACRISLDVGAKTITETDMIMPGGLMEVLTKYGADTLSAKCKPGETATLHIVCGGGD